MPFLERAFPPEPLRQDGGGSQVLRESSISQLITSLRSLSQKGSYGRAKLWSPATLIGQERGLELGKDHVGAVGTTGFVVPLRNFRPPLTTGSTFYS